jgi:DNA-binding response OmpR family regulator
MTAPNVPTPLPLTHEQIAGRTLLIVDDEPVIRMIARTTLSLAGFDVTEAGDEAAALAALQKATRPFDLILLDLTLGGTNGADLIPTIRQMHAAARILVISGHDPEEAAGIGADGFLAKPFTKTSLLIAVWQLLASAPTPSPRCGEETSG